MLALRRFTTERPLTTLLAADAAIEIACGLALLAWRERFQAWFGINEIAVYSTAAVFLAAAIVPIAFIVSHASRPNVSALAWANVVGGAAGWLLFPFVWSYFEPEGRWIFAAVCDTFIALGVAQLIALRRSRN